MGIGHHTWLGVEGDAQTSLANHRQVVYPIAHGNGLGQVNLFHLGDELEQFRLAVPIHNVAKIIARQFAILVNLQFVGIHVIDAKFLLKILAEIGESTTQNGNLIAASLQHTHQAVGSLGDRHVLGDVFHHAGVETLEQRHTLLETLLEIDLTTHGSRRNFRHLVAHAGTLGQLVDTLGLDKR